MPTLVIGDAHLPFADRRVIAKVATLASSLAPAAIVQVGDLYDLYSFSKYDRSLNLMTPAQEVNRGRDQAARLWQRLRQAAPTAACYQLLGNHDERLAKRLISALPEAETLFDFRSLWAFDGVETVAEPELLLRGVVYMHGFRKHGDHVRHNLRSTVVGHSHQGGVVFQRVGGKTLFELNAGYIALSTALPFAYRMQRRFCRWTPGVGVIDSLGPRFIPL
jgi:metallophosphoesterase superfamily enzyme